MTIVKLAWLTLRLLPGLGSRSLLKLVRHFGSPEAVLSAKAAEICGVAGLRPHAVKALLDRQPSRDPAAEWQALENQGFDLVCLGDPEYPVNLAAIHDPPVVLYVWWFPGTPEIWWRLPWSVRERHHRWGWPSPKG